MITVQLMIINPEANLITYELEFLCYDEFSEKFEIIIFLEKRGKEQDLLAEYQDHYKDQVHLYLGFG